MSWIHVRDMIRVLVRSPHKHHAVPVLPVLSCSVLSPCYRALCSPCAVSVLSCCLCRGCKHQVPTSPFPTSHQAQAINDESLNGAINVGSIR